jgi:hypothetical protein
MKERSLDQSVEGPTSSTASSAEPWPYGETKVYDPTGLWQRNERPGPYNKGGGLLSSELRTHMRREAA